MRTVIAAAALMLTLTACDDPAAAITDEQLVKLFGIQVRGSDKSTIPEDAITCLRLIAGQDLGRGVQERALVNASCTSAINKRLGDPVKNEAGLTYEALQNSDLIDRVDALRLALKEQKKTTDAAYEKERQEQDVLAAQKTRARDAVMAAMKTETTKRLQHYGSLPRVFKELNPLCDEWQRLRTEIPADKQRDHWSLPDACSAGLQKNSSDEAVFYAADMRPSPRYLKEGPDGLHYEIPAPSETLSAVSPENIAAAKAQLTHQIVEMESILGN